MKLLAVFLRHSWRYHSRHPVLTLLNIAGVAVGLAVFTSIRTVNSSSLAAFAAGTQLVTGPAQLSIRAEGDRFNESVFETVRAAGPEWEAQPIVEELALLPNRPGDYLQLIGFDPLVARESVRFSQSTEPSSGGSFFDFMTDPAAIALTSRVAERLGVNVGDSVPMHSPGGQWLARVVAIVEVEQVNLEQMEHLAFMDLANLQERFDLRGRLNRIDLRLPPSADLAAVRAALQPKLPPNLRVDPPSAQQDRFEKMTQAFRLNLLALSLISLLVGCFLVYNTLTAAVVRRRREWGVLRAIGVRSNQLTLLVIAEALVLAIPAALFGMALGIGLAWGLLQPVLASMTSHYVRIQASAFAVNPMDLGIAFIAGIGSVVLAAWRPGHEAARLPVVEALLPARGNSADSWALLGRWTSLAAMTALLGVSTWGLLEITGWPWLGFGVALFALLTFAFLSPLAAWSLLKLRQRLGKRPGLIASLAAQNFWRGQSRIAVTIAALVVALAMVGGLSIMVHSFRETVVTWISGTLRADLYVAPASNFQYGIGERLPPAVLAQLAAYPEVAALNLYRETTVDLAGEPARLAATRLDVLQRFQPPRFLDSTGLGEPRGELDVWISDILARKRGLEIGSILSVATPAGVQSLRVQAIYQDFSSEQGQILMDLPVYQRLWQDNEIHTSAIYLQPGVESAKFRQTLTADLAKFGEFAIVSSGELRQRAMQIFDQTFAITDVLKWMALGIAMLGVTISLLTLIAERIRELGLLRAAGMTRSQMQRLILLESAWIGGTASVLGVAAGFVLAAILSYLINVQFFGWTIEWHVPWQTIIAMPITTGIAAALAAAWPAVYAGRLAIAEAMREEE